MNKPELGGGITPQQWLRSGAALDNYGQADMRATEARRIADYITALENAADGQRTRP